MASIGQAITMLLGSSSKDQLRTTSTIKCSVCKWLDLISVALEVIQPKNCAPDGINLDPFTLLLEAIMILIQKTKNLML